MSKRLRLPPPPKEYSQEYEKVRNREIEVVVNEKISNTDASVYSGVPFVSAHGLNSAWSVPVGSTPIIVPFDTIVKDTDIAIDFDIPGHFAYCNFIVDAFISTNLYIPSTGGSTVFDVIAQIYINGTSKYTITKSVNTRDNNLVNLVAHAIGVLPVDATIKIYVYHTSLSAVVFDLTKSDFTVSRWSQLPRIK
jgi:hypothetical protein